jgi:hypothetical protein
VNPRTVSVAEGLFVLCAGPLVAASCLTWWLIGIQDEPLGEDQWFSIGFAEENSLLIGTVGLLAVALVALALRGWPQPWRAPVLVPLAISAFCGAYLGLFFRGATSKVTGANIGTGILVLVSPAVLVMLTWAVYRVVRLVHGLRAAAR